jgi:hypothetical protein
MDHPAEYENLKLAKAMRGRTRAAVSQGRKCASTMELVGCTIEELREHLEAQFGPGMTWKNRGEWHIDHIRPCVSFDLSDPAQQRECFHYTNLQPLWAHDNLVKHTKWNGAA